MCADDEMNAFNIRPDTFVKRERKIANLFASIFSRIVMKFMFVSHLLMLMRALCFIDGDNINFHFLCSRRWSWCFVVDSATRYHMHSIAVARACAVQNHNGLKVQRHLVDKNVLLIQFVWAKLLSIDFHTTSKHISYCQRENEMPSPLDFLFEKAIPMNGTKFNNYEMIANVEPDWFCIPQSHLQPTTE